MSIKRVSSSSIRRGAGVALALLLGCGTVTAGIPAERPSAGVDTGAVRIFNYAGNTIVAIDTFSRGADGLVDQWYVLERESPATLQLPVYLPLAEVRYRNGAIRVSAPDAKRVWDFAVTGYDGSWPAPQRGVDVILTEGYGLAHYDVKTTVPILQKNDHECTGCEIFEQ